MDIPASVPVSRRRDAFALLAAASAALCVWCVGTSPLRVSAGGPAWERLVRGARADGYVASRATLLLPGVPRVAVASVLIETAADQLPRAIGVSVDGSPPRVVRAGAAQPLLVALPATGGSGARVDLTPADGPLMLRRIRVAEPRARPWGTSLLAAALAALLAYGMERRLAGAARPLALATGALLAAAAAPPLLWLSLPGGHALLRLLPALAAAALALTLAARLEPSGRRTAARGLAVVVAFVFGAWIRGAFLPSAGSWDTEYWKTWMLRAVTHGVTGAYGDPEPFDAGRLLRQARGQQPLWKAPRAGRDYVVDYPPLAMAAWSASFRIVTRLAPGIERAEAENVAVKLPAIAGDLGGVLLLLWALRDRPARALGLAAAYWALPVSWLSSAVLGFLDAALAPLTAAALVAAGRGRAAACGVGLALACLIKPTAAIVAPAAIVALLARGMAPWGAALWGIGIGAAAMVPFAFAGTLTTAVVQCYRILFQERLSGGFPNPWWLVGHAVTVAHHGAAAFWEPVRFVRVDALGLPARALGLASFLVVAAYVLWRQRGRAGAAPALLAGAVLFFAYGLFAVGVHENHPHPLYLLLFATGLASRRLRLLTVATSCVYVLNMLAMSGLGRFYGPRYLALEPLIQAAAAFRMALGIDVTLPLTFVNLAALGWALTWLEREMEALAAPVAS